jgi:IstB-like ATP binding protein
MLPLPSVPFRAAAFHHVEVSRRSPVALAGGDVLGVERLGAARGQSLPAAEGVSASQIAELARGDWIARGENVLLAGPIGTGKTHLAIALGVEAARQRRRIVFWRAADLVRTLVETRDAKELGPLLFRGDKPRSGLTYVREMLLCHRHTPRPHAHEHSIRRRGTCPHCHCGE